MTKKTEEEIIKEIRKTIREKWIILEDDLRKKVEDKNTSHDEKEKLFNIAETRCLAALLVEDLGKEAVLLRKNLVKENSKLGNIFTVGRCEPGRNDKRHYYWIKMESADNPCFKYCLGLCREDLDPGTGNVHQYFTRLQMSKCEFKTKEDSVNPYPVKKQKEDFFRVYYFASNCFPRAIAGNNEKCVKKDDTPWGYTDFKFEYGEEKITAGEMSEEIMDRANLKYDPKKVASFFLQLCKYDVEMCEKESK